MEARVRAFAGNLPAPLFGHEATHILTYIFYMAFNYPLEGISHPDTQCPIKYGSASPINFKANY